MKNEIVINLKANIDEVNNFIDFDILFLNCDKHKKFSLNQKEFLDFLARLNELKKDLKWDL